jgi:pimeloyl-ACP methyl ester carboxylesterase
MTSAAVAISGFNPTTTSFKMPADVTIGVVRSVPPGARAIGLPVAVDAAVPSELGLDRATLVASGFDGKVGQTLMVPRPEVLSFVAIGIGDPAKLDASKLRDAAASRTDEPVWQLPLDQRYRRQLYSNIADIRNIGGDQPGAITAALFLAEFVGSVPWAHLDIAGTVKADADEAWRSAGATGFGARLQVDLALNFTPPAS